MSAWTPPPPPHRRGGKWKWVVGALAVLVVVGLVVNGLGSADVAADARTSPVPAATPPSSAAVDAELEQRQRETLDRNLDQIGERLNERRAAAGMPRASQYGDETSATYGEPIEVVNLVVTAERPETHSQQYVGQQVCAEVSYRNTGSRSESFNPYDWEFRSASGGPVSVTAAWNAGGEGLGHGDLTPGESTSGLVCGELGTLDVTSVVYAPGASIPDKVVWSE